MSACVGAPDGVGAAMAGAAITAAPIIPIKLSRILVLLLPTGPGRLAGGGRSLLSACLAFGLCSAVLRVHDRDVRRLAGAVANQAGLAGAERRAARLVERAGVALDVRDGTGRVVARGACRHGGRLNEGRRCRLGGHSAGRVE